MRPTSSRARRASRSTSARRPTPRARGAIDDLDGSSGQSPTGAGSQRRMRADLRRAGGHLRCRRSSGPRGGRARGPAIAPRRLPSGAGHDALAIAALVPDGMLFVRCKGGISHHPAESDHRRGRGRRRARAARLPPPRRAPGPEAASTGRSGSPIPSLSWPRATRRRPGRRGRPDRRAGAAGGQPRRRTRALRRLRARRAAGPDQHPPPLLPDADPRLPAGHRQGAVPLAGGALPDLGAARRPRTCGSRCGWRWPSCCCRARTTTGDHHYVFPRRARGRDRHRGRGGAAARHPGRRSPAAR